jgi:Na+/melibiose symporter-like transporter
MPAKQDIYSVGTLTYTKMGLVALCLWLMWGAVCATLLWRSAPSATLPLLLVGESSGINATGTEISTLLVVIPTVIGAIVAPIVGVWSDRHRGRRGRRIPFLLWSAPAIALATVLIGLIPWLRSVFVRDGLVFGMDARAAVLLTIALCVGLFYALDEFASSILMYLYVDVVPERVLARVLWVLRCGGIVSGALFGWLVYPYVEGYRHWVALGIGLAYVAGIYVMCRGLREGHYPPPDDLSGRGGILNRIGVYLRECFSHWLYILLYGQAACAALMGVAGLGAIVFYTDGLGLSLHRMGTVGSYLAVASLILGLPAAWAVDKYHPVRIALWVQVPLILAQLYAFFGLRDMGTYLTFHMVNTLILAFEGAAMGPLFMRLLPRDKFGQFSSCRQLVRAVAVLGGGVAGAWFMDQMTNAGQDKDAFRWMFVWGGALQLLAFVCLLGAYRWWQRLGGDTDYLAPGSALDRQRRAAAMGNESGQALEAPSEPPSDQ